MIHCHPKTQLLTTFAHVTTFTFNFFCRKKKNKNPKACYGTTLSHEQSDQKLYIEVVKDHVSNKKDNKSGGTYYTRAERERQDSPDS
jgi:hypothetical protein